MAHYTGRRSPSPGEASASRVENAAYGPRANCEAKLRMIRAYIIEEAARQKIGVAEVVCPSKSRWEQLSVGRHRRLPSEMELRLNCGRLRKPGDLTPLRELAFAREAERYPLNCALSASLGRLLQRKRRRS